MAVQIGASAHSFSNPTGLLSDCHRRIEMFLGTLQAVAQVINRPLSDDVAGPLRSALRYFREAAPSHTADEEDSLFPRLRQVRHPDVQMALDQLESLEKDHQWAAPLHADVECLGQNVPLERSTLTGGRGKVPRSRSRPCVYVPATHQRGRHICLPCGRPPLIANGSDIDR